MSTNKIHIFESIILGSKIKGIIGIKNNTSIFIPPLKVSDGQRSDDTSL